MKTHDSVAILMFNSSQQSLVLVKQFRPAVYVGEVERRFPGSLAAVDQDGPRQLQVALPGSVGVTYELCAGLVDQPGLSLEEVACTEAWEVWPPPGSLRPAPGRHLQVWCGTHWLQPDYVLRRGDRCPAGRPGRRPGRGGRAH
uniref:Nudix hydrolase 14 n=1 Tax=Ursus maritimus TaxID=29073 RepID=A0A452VKQ2_URSMA